MENLKPPKMKRIDKPWDVNEMIVHFIVRFLIIRPELNKRVAF